jgi:DNA polymerase III delta' subunit
VNGALTRGHPAALAAVGSMIRGQAPHALLLVGPAGIGKTTLARDLAAGLLCTADIAQRPCGECRPCRLVAAGHHPDVHRIGPDGPGRQVVIGGAGAKVRGVRDLLSELSLLPVEGGARIAIIESASRMNDDAQAALLKTLEEPPAGVTLILCADTEETLLPTIRSRCARLRLGPVGVREIETILADGGFAEPPLAGRLARISDGRPGVAIAWARDPDALRVRDELARILLDLLRARPGERLSIVRAAAGAAARLAVVADRPADDTGVGPAPAATATRGRGAGRAGAKAAPAPGSASADPAATQDPDAADGTTDPDADDAATSTRTPAAERRRAAEALLALWTDVARDLALVSRGLGGSVRELGLLDDTTAAAASIDPAAIGPFLDRLGRAGVLIAGNVAPELVLDDLALAWPRAQRPAA